MREVTPLGCSSITKTRTRGGYGRRLCPRRKELLCDVPVYDMRDRTGKQAAIKDGTKHALFSATSYFGLLRGARGALSEPGITPSWKLLAGKSDLGYAGLGEKQPSGPVASSFNKTLAEEKVFLPTGQLRAFSSGKLCKKKKGILRRARDFSVPVTGTGSAPVQHFRASKVAMV